MTIIVGYNPSNNIISKNQDSHHREMVFQALSTHGQKKNNSEMILANDNQFIYFFQ